MFIVIVRFNFRQNILFLKFSYLYVINVFKSGWEGTKPRKADSHDSMYACLVHLKRDEEWGRKFLDDGKLEDAPLSEVKTIALIQDISAYMFVELTGVYLKRKNKVYGDRDYTYSKMGGELILIFKSKFSLC